MVSSKLVLRPNRLQALQIRRAPLLDNESDPSTQKWSEESRRRTRWILALIISFLIGFSLGVILHDHIVKFNPGGPVWKSFPLD